MKLSTDINPVLPETELRQALLNLLLNSIQEISGQGGTVTVDVSSNNQQLSIAVQDSGSGFPEAILSKGIKPFVSTREHGTGLGLSMVQRFAKSHNGHLVLSNNAQGHACATLIFPV